MPSQPTRELAITYGGFTVGGDQAARVLRDIHITSDSYEQTRVQYRFTIKQSTDAQFRSEVSIAETAFRTPHQDFTVSVNGVAIRSLTAAASSGFNAEATLEKSGEKSDSVLTRTYSVSVTFGRPADTSGSGGRRITKTEINVAYTPARRRTVTISGEYTTLSGSGARAVYTAAIDSYATSVLNAFGGTYKLLEEPTTSSDDANAVIRFSRSYEEIIFTGVGAGDADLRKETCVISRSKVGPGDTPSGSTVERLVTLNVSYEAWFNKENVSDITSRWPGLLSSIMSQVTTILTGGAVALIDESPSFDLTDNRITAQLTVQGSTQGGVIENRVTTEFENLSGLSFVPVWNKGPYDRLIFQGPATQRKTVTIAQKSLSSAGNSPGAGGPGAGNGAPGAVGGSFGGGIVNNGPGSISLPGGGSINIFGGPMTGAQITALVNAVISDGDPSGGGGGGGPQGGGGLGNFYPVSNNTSTTPIRLGRGSYTFDIVETTIVSVWERADPVGAPAGGTST